METADIQPLEFQAMHGNPTHFVIFKFTIWLQINI